MAVWTRSGPPGRVHLVVRRGAAGGLLVGHTWSGGVARAVSRRSVTGMTRRDPGEPDWQRPGAGAWSLVGTAAAGGHGLLAGVNAAGLAVAACRGDAAGWVRGLLESAASVAEAAAVADLPDAPPGTCVVVADAAGAVLLRRRAAGGVDARPLRPGQADAGAGALLPVLRRPPDERGARGIDGATAAAGLAVALVPGRRPEVLLCLGPPCCTAFLRCWPGIEVAPALSGSNREAPPLSLLAIGLAERAPGAADWAAMRRVLDPVEAEALEEGAAADRMALAMDAAGDDRGAEVRLLVAQLHAAELVEGALRGLVAPGGEGAPPGVAL